MHVAKCGGSLWGLPPPSPTPHRLSVPSFTLTLLLPGLVMAWPGHAHAGMLKIFPKPRVTVKSHSGTPWRYTQASLTLVIIGHSGGVGCLVALSPHQLPAGLSRCGGGCLPFFPICHPRSSPTFPIPALWTSAVLRNAGPCSHLPP